MNMAAPCRMPYKDLFIYYVKGRVRGGPIADGDAFIGNWEEEDDSFLFFRRPADACVQNLLLRQPHLRLQTAFKWLMMNGRAAPWSRFRWAACR
jgi:hypothetical protein